MADAVLAVGFCIVVEQGEDVLYVAPLFIVEGRRQVGCGCVPSRLSIVRLNGEYLGATYVLTPIVSSTNIGFFVLIMLFKTFFAISDGVILANERETKTERLIKNSSEQKFNVATYDLSPSLSLLVNPYTSNFRVTYLKSAEVL
jgi:hypothetical protein